MVPGLVVPFIHVLDLLAPELRVTEVTLEPIPAVIEQRHPGWVASSSQGHIEKQPFTLTLTLTDNSVSN